MAAPIEFEQRLGSTGIAAVIALFACFAALAYWQVFRTDLATNEHNPRVLASFSNPARGRILDRNGGVLASSNPDGTRHYTDASVAHVIGYLDARYGSRGTELAFNDYLEGLAGNSWSSAIDAEFRREVRQGNDVRTTIDPKIQAAAVAALGSRRGAVIALDPRTGEVLASVSVPTYDPGSLATNGDALLNDPTSPLLNRAAQGLYPPGSTFKTVTAISALESGVVTPATQVTCHDQVVIDGFPIACDNVPQGEGTYTFKDAYTYSVNAIFAQVGVDTGWDQLLSTASRLGFGSALGFTIDTAPTQVVPEGTELTETLLASTAFGQGEILTTPLQMAVVAAAVANGGVIADPHLGLAAYSGDQRISGVESPGSRRAFSAEVAAIMVDFMVSVIDSGQAQGAAIPGVKVGGKTGTAETGHGTTHAWFISFAPAENPIIAVAVVLEEGGLGSRDASPVAGAVMKAALGK